MNDTNKNQDDITLEPSEESENLGDLAERVKKLKEQLKTCQKERLEYLSGWQRAKADYINARKDEEKAQAHMLKYANEDVLKDILPALESFQGAFGNKAAWEKVDLNWRMGVQYIYSQLLAAMEKNGVKPIEPAVGEPFDERKHESVGIIPAGEGESKGTIVEVVSKGYALHGKILRPAKVKVSE